MFTGIIRNLGTIQSTRQQPAGSIVLDITAEFSKDLHEGDSVSVNGVCLTVLSHTDTLWVARLMAETITKTTLGSLPAQSTVNLELPTQAGDFLHGHIVQGHVDGICTIQDITEVGGDEIFTLTPSKDFLKKIVPKGSIALDGVSLTVIDVTDSIFTVSLMPYTLSHTTFGTKKIGDVVNMETDHTRDTLWLSGLVVQGNRRGTTLGFPTANIALDANSTRPIEGIYACRAMLADDPTLYAGALHVGPRPTFKDAADSVELHLINFSPRDLYERTISFMLVEKIRDVKKFESPEALTSAIAKDVAKATSILMYH